MVFTYLPLWIPSINDLKKVNEAQIGRYILLHLIHLRRFVLPLWCYSQVSEYHTGLRHLLFLQCPFGCLDKKEGKILKINSYWLSTILFSFKEFGWLSKSPKLTLVSCGQLCLYSNRSYTWFFNTQLRAHTSCSCLWIKRMKELFY